IAIHRSTSALHHTPHAPHLTLFPYTTLFRSTRRSPRHAIGRRRSRLGAGRDPAGSLKAARAFPLRPTRLARRRARCRRPRSQGRDRKSTRLNSSHVSISYAVFCLKKKTHTTT